MSVNLSVKNVPDGLAQRLRDRAERNRRSLQGELMVILEEAVDERGGFLTPAEVYARARTLELPETSASADILRRERDEREGR